MIKLVTQFDNEKSKLSLATPTCGCCSCCCCCCIITTLGASNISARTFSNSALQTKPKKLRNIKTAKVYGFCFPIGLIACLFLGLLLNFLLKINSNNYIINYLIPTSLIFIYSIIMGILIKKKTNSPEIFLNMVFIIVITAILETIGFYLGMLLIIAINFFYLIVAPFIAYVIFCNTFKDDFKYSKSNKRKK